MLLTSGYPFSKKGEEFIEPEMRFLAKKDYDVQICAVTPELTTNINQYKPDNVAAITLFSHAFSGIEKVKCMISSFFRPQFWKEFFELLRCGKAKKIRTMVAFCSRGERIFKALNRIIDKDQEIVLYSYWLVDTAYAIAILKQKYGYRVVSRVHGGDLYEERNDGYLPMRRYLFDTLDAVYSVSEKGTKYLIEKYGHTETIRTAYLGTENHYTSTALEKHDYFHIVSCSYLVPLKRVPMIAEALSMIVDRKIVWTHFGDGQDRDAVFDIVSHFPNNITFDFKGNTPHSQIIDFYCNHQIDLFINVSTTEGLPISIMEAISFGIPVIATDVGGTSEIVTSEANGLLIPGYISATELARIIREFCSLSEKEKIELGKKGREIWNNKFNAQRQYKKFYQDLNSGKDKYQKNKDFFI